MINPFARFSPGSQGILCLLAALVFLTFGDSIIKWLSPAYALHELMLFRAVFALPVVLMIIKLEGGWHLVKTRRPYLHIARGMMMVLANMFFFLGLATLPLAETIALFFVAPLFICLLAQPILGEKVGWQRWGAIFIGLVGVVVMVRPGADVFRYESLLPIGAAFTYALMQMMTRKLGLQERAGTLTFYIQVSFVFVCIISGLLIGDGQYAGAGNSTLDFLLRAWQAPAFNDFKLLVLCGALVAAGFYFMSQAYRITQVSVIAPFEYASMPLALAVGYVIWKDWPDLVSFAGTGLIVVSGLIVLTVEKHERRRPMIKEY